MNKIGLHIIKDKLKAHEIDIVGVANLLKRYHKTIYMRL